MPTHPPFKLPKWLPFAVIGFVLALWAGSWWYVSGLDKPGEFGDQFGAINALFSGLAFAGVIYAILLQRQELELQRLELEATRNVLREQERQLEQQAQTMQQQNFESTFFHMIEVFNDMVSRLIMAEPGSGNEARDRTCLKVGYQQFKKAYKKARETYTGEKEVNVIRMAFKNFWEGYQPFYGCYIRQLLSLIRLASEQDLNPSTYSQTINAQLSTYEHGLLFYYCLSDLGSNEDLQHRSDKLLVESLGILEHLSGDVIIHMEHIELYDPKAFGQAGISQLWQVKSLE